jgi:hypothetical protein
MKDNRAKGLEAASLHASYEFYFGPRRLMPFADWWRQVNDALQDEGGETLPGYYRGRSWWLEGLSPAEAVTRHLENLESAQEEQSYYDV